MSVQRRRLASNARDTERDIPRRTPTQVEDYLVLCLRYREVPDVDDLGPNPHGPHARGLRERSERDRDPGREG